MKLTTPQIEQVAGQLQARAVPENSRMAPDLERHFGDHTFFLDNAGLHILEPTEAAETGRVVKVASWTDEQCTALALHEPESSDVTIKLDAAA